MSGFCSSLACTNIIENALGTVRQVGRTVKRWTAAGMIEASKTLRRLKAHRQPPMLRAALDAHAERARSNGTLEAVRTAA